MFCFAPAKRKAVPGTAIAKLAENIIWSPNEKYRCTAPKKMPFANLGTARNLKNN